MGFVAQNGWPVTERVAQIAPLKGAKLRGDDVVLPPGSRGDSQEHLESPEDRKKRLQDAGILPVPTPVPTPQSAFSKAIDSIGQKAKLSDETLAPLGLRLGFGVGPWYVIKAPKNTTYLADLSYQIFTLFPLSTTPVSANWGKSIYVGGGALFINGTTTAKVPDTDGELTQIYADSNMTELGGIFSCLVEKSVLNASTLMFDFRAQYFPLKQYKTIYRTFLSVPHASEVRSKTAANLLGVGGAAAFGFNFARIATISAFLATEVSTPFQVRFRYGLRLEASSFLLPEPAPQSQQMPSPQATPFPLPTPSGGH